MKSQILLSRCKINDKCCRNIGKCIKLISLAEVYHIPDKSLLVRDLPMKLKMIKWQTFFTKLMVFEAKRILSPFEEYSLVGSALCKSTSKGKGSLNCLMVIAFAEIIVSGILLPLLDGFHFHDVYKALWRLLSSHKTFWFSLIESILAIHVTFRSLWSWLWRAFVTKLRWISRCLLILIHKLIIIV